MPAEARSAVPGREFDVSGDTRSLYERDAVLWADSQARALRTRRLADLDFDHLAEEIEDVSGRLRSELQSRTRTIIENLLKLRHSPASEPRLGWIETIERSRAEIDDLLVQAPSLEPTLVDVIGEVAPRASKLATISLERADEVVAAKRCAADRSGFEHDQVFGDWLPERSEPT